MMMALLLLSLESWDLPTCFSPIQSMKSVDRWVATEGSSSFLRLGEASPVPRRVGGTVGERRTNGLVSNAATGRIPIMIPARGMLLHVCVAINFCHDRGDRSVLAPSLAKGGCSFVGICRNVKIALDGVVANERPMQKHYFHLH